MKSLLLLVLFGLAPTVSLLAEPSNLIANPGFESQSDGWILLIPPESEGLVEPLQVISDSPHEGNTCAATRATAPVRYGLGPKKPIPVQPGERYRIVAWVKLGDDAFPKDHYAPVVYVRATLLATPTKAIDDPKGHMHLGLDGRMARTPDVGRLAPTDLPKDWYKIEGVVEIPPDTSYLALTLFSHSVTGTVYWDDIRVEKVSTDTPLSKNVN